jgi:hypothetical protein
MALTRAGHQDAELNQPVSLPRSTLEPQDGPIRPQHRCLVHRSCLELAIREGRGLEPANRHVADVVALFRVCRMHSARGGAPEGKLNGNYRHGARSKETIELWKIIKAIR